MVAGDDKWEEMLEAVCMTQNNDHLMVTSRSDWIWCIPEFLSRKMAAVQYQVLSVVLEEV